MRAVLQRVSRAEVRVGGVSVGRIGAGLLVLLGVGAGDEEEDADYLARKIAELRIFEDDVGKMNLSLLETGGEMLAVSQFTLYGDCRKGRRPGYSDAAPPERAVPLYERFVERVRALGVGTATGRFGAMMDVELVNDGPVTLMLDSKKNF
ncbi:MAG: D-aminoacyl-tRNA deacylase [Deltaproteobacteria bacterium]|nr:D-aminoacyl-tRNA deacylase [Deltaproteobacteria bacterium]